MFYLNFHLEHQKNIKIHYDYKEPLKNNASISHSNPLFRARHYLTKPPLPSPSTTRRHEIFIRYQKTFSPPPYLAPLRQNVVVVVVRALRRQEDT